MRACIKDKQCVRCIANVNSITTDAPHTMVSNVGSPWYRAAMHTIFRAANAMATSSKSLQSIMQLLWQGPIQSRPWAAQSSENAWHCLVAASVAAITHYGPWGWRGLAFSVGISSGWYLFEKLLGRLQGANPFTCSDASDFGRTFLCVFAHSFPASLPEAQSCPYGARLACSGSISGASSFAKFRFTALSLAAQLSWSDITPCLRLRWLNSAYLLAPSAHLSSVSSWEKMHFAPARELITGPAGTPLGLGPSVAPPGPLCGPGLPSPMAPDTHHLHCWLQSSW